MRTRISLLVLTALAIGTSNFVSTRAAGQQSTRDELSGLDASAPPTVVSLPHTSYWKFGLRIKASGRTTGIQATLPVPIPWSDQLVELISIEMSDSVTSAKIKKLGADAKQLFIKVNRLNSGEVAEAFALMKIEKLESIAPTDTGQFKFVSRAPSNVRKYLNPSPFIESKHERIIELADSIPIVETDDAWDQVKTIYEWVRDNVEYRFDKEIRSCLHALDNGHGDCEELSSLFIAICRARGIPARAVWIPAHTYPEFYLIDEQGKGHWFPCQAAGSYAFGHMPEAKPILQKGDKFRVRGHRKPLRYIQPTLEARDAPVAPNLEWIMTEVEPPKKK